MRFNPDLLELIPASQLDADFGGDHAYEFEPNSYWEQIVSWVYCTMPGAPMFIWVIIRACGIADDGTRVTKSETSSGIISIFLGQEKDTKVTVTTVSAEDGTA
jgi:hypothetical protein